MNVQLHLGDCLEVLAGLPENSVDTCITDPPYELGFMGKKWDSSGIAFQPETWQAVWRVLKPGALLLAFGGTRTYHRMVCAIEDAGFEIRDTIAWVYGSGFPKSYDISKGIDKQAGAQREVVGKQFNIANKGNDNTGRYNWNTEGQARKESIDITAPATPAAQLWDGWGTALKPAFEPIVVAMKPIDGTFVNNALTWGVAGLNIDGGRVGSETITQHQNSHRRKFGERFVTGNNHPVDGITTQTQGRFPANFIHDGSDEVVELFPQTTSGARAGGDDFKLGRFENESGAWGLKKGRACEASSGSAARFFYCAKASRSERNAGLEGTNHHPTIKPIELMRYLVRLTKTPTGGVVLDPFMGSGTTGCACVLEGREFIGIEREAEYVEIAEKRIAHYRLPILDDKWIPEVQE